MARKVTRTDSKKIDRLLQVLEETWSSLPRVEAQIDSWNLTDRVNFVVELPLDEQRLKRLERYVLEGALSEDQLSRYDELKKVVSKNRPVMDRLRSS